MKRFATLTNAQAAGCFALPLVVVGVMLAGGRSAPPVVEASSVLPEESTDDPRYPQVTPRGALHGQDALALLAESERLADLAPVPSPFPQHERYASEGDEPMRITDPAQPDFSLTSVLSAPGGALCVINERVRRAGDQVEPGWSVKSIDAAARRVVLTGPGGREVVLAQR